MGAVNGLDSHILMANFSLDGAVRRVRKRHLAALMHFPDTQVARRTTTRIPALPITAAEVLVGRRA